MKRVWNGGFLGMVVVSVGLGCAALGSAARADGERHLYANADACEPSQEQLVRDRSNSGSKPALWRLANHYNLCVQDDNEAKIWLRKLADMNDPSAMVILGAWADTDGDHRQAVEWAKRAARLGYDANAEVERELRRQGR